MNIEMSSSARSGTGNCVKEGLKKVYEKIDTPEYWRKSFLLVCVVALAIDPLFLFIPEIDYLKLCIGYDETLRTIVCVLRILIDVLYVIYIIGSETFLRDKMSGRKRLFYVMVDTVSLLPIPVVMVLLLRTEWSNNLVLKRILKWTIVGQYIPRIIRIYPVYKAVTKTTVTIAESKWIGALLNLLLFLLCSYVFGAFWYVTAIEKLTICWYDFWKSKIMHEFGNEARRGDPWPRQDNITKLFCAHNLVVGINNSIFLLNSCPITDPEKLKKPSKKLAGLIEKLEYDFGMYGEVVKSEVGSSNLRDFSKKFLYCFWWGLRNLSLKTGNSASDILFAIIICASGLFLFAVLIGNVQKYLLSSTVRADEMEERKKDIEKWMTFRNLPEELKKRIKENEKTIWKHFRGTDEEELLRRFPEDLRREIQPFLDEHSA
ncbi:PREDICTED: probable cyclic nucleotide-gated ion channel 12 isoform X2 [Camelina sativa]|uniref:Probable cyclic nucleotide-gated ion channel 12 isoform X2 n=1 Tax=Camelina sativa TaxID=90675 RepID=A0ABM0YS51_CAMSA|nr:PREDICTED: probable cyclic nucleotide-gated ion channel 12 isoform X2 [Camelina sativa]